jgi:hypothetical protein
MKILVPFMNPTNTLPGEGALSGGIEKFIIQIQETFDDVKIVQLPFVLNKIHSKKYSDIIIKTARHFNADLIISNYCKGWCMGPYLQKNEFPIMSINHSAPEFPFKVRSCTRWFGGLNLNKHSLYFVSKYQKTRWLNFRTKKYLLPFEIDGYIHSSYCSGDKPKINENIQWDTGTIGRCNKDKAVFKVHTLLKNTNLKGLVLTSKPFGYDFKYYEKHKEYKNTLIGLPHNKVMKNLSTFATFFATSEETWGICCLEALSYGIPIILNSKEYGHGSEIIPKDKRHYKCIQWDNKEELVSAINDLKKVDRTEIQDMTWDKHSQKEWKRHFENCIDKTIEKHKRNTLL